MSENSTEIAGTVDQRNEYVTEFDPDAAASVATQTAMAVADATGRDVMDISPLGKWVDCDAITELFRCDCDTPVSISFCYEQSRVFLSSEGRIVVSPRDATGPTAG
ncbi:HalOD1 output domain-containing protein [Haloarchaeobius sp. HRN-SO-5]|uniref:HalOD1 output domain-containing protein n=1 Tax=Haloarchaeobius sp. HRN-SO-5 TaxID=3446118 RepID=UPI003EBC1AA4